MYYVYVIKSILKNYFYVGMTNNLERRLSQHNNGQSKTTRSYEPFFLFYSEIIENRVEARQREKYLKSGSGKEFLKSQLK